MANRDYQPTDTGKLDEIYSFLYELNEKIARLPLEHTATFPLSLPGVLGKENYFTVKRLDTPSDNNIQGFLFVHEPSSLQNPDIQPKEIVILFRPPESFYVATGLSKDREQEFEKVKAALVQQVIDAIEKARKYAGNDARFNITLAGSSLAGQDMQYMSTALMEAILEEDENKRRENLEKIVAINLASSNAFKVSHEHAKRSRALLERLQFSKSKVALNSYHLIDVEKPHHWVGHAHVDTDWPPVFANVHARVQVGKDSKTAIDLDNKREASRKALSARLAQHSSFITSPFFRIFYTVAQTLKKTFWGVFHKKKKPTQFPSKFNILPETGRSVPEEYEAATLRASDPLQENMPMPPIENLVFQGGGVKGLVHVGALEELEENGLLKNLKRVGGSSAGGIIAFFLAIGYTPTELEQEIKIFEFSKLKDDGHAGSPSGVRHLQNLVSFLDKKGIYDGNLFYEKMQSLLIKKLTAKNKDLTFRELEELRLEHPELHLKELTLTGMNLTENCVDIFSAERTPEMRVLDALRITMSVPGAFKPIKMVNPNGIEVEYVDGGVGNNFPMFIYDRKELVPEGYTLTETGANPGTLGFMIIPEEDLRKRWGIHLKRAGDHGLLAFGGQLFQGLRLQGDEFNARYGINVIPIYNEKIGTLDFSLDDASKEKLLASGRHTIKEWIRFYRAPGSLYAIKKYKSFEEKYRGKNIEALILVANQIREKLASLEKAYKALSEEYHKLILQKGAIDNLDEALSERIESEEEVDARFLEQIGGSQVEIQLTKIEKLTVERDNLSEELEVVDNLILQEEAKIQQYLKKGTRGYVRQFRKEGDTRDLGSPTEGEELSKRRDTPRLNPDQKGRK
ncbi:MAG TPA: patatin-like phospholipase family protein [Gammaproteobacteria bacterium]|nr:patatin-like phospholipase family protein [Gammaproteobacteria bacterium]